MNETWVTISGNVVADPILRTTVNGPVTSFRLASSSSWRGDDGIWRDGPTSFFDVSCWRRVGENVAESVHQGQPVLVHGKLVIREWENENGKGRSASIEAAHIGHDLKHGTAKFVRVARVAEVASDPSPDAVAQLTPAQDRAAEAAA